MKALQNLILLILFLVMQACRNPVEALRYE